MKRTNAEWKRLLTPEQYAVLRERATDIPFEGAYVYNEQDGVYACAACGAKLFASEYKFEAHCGWPSFNNVIDNNAVILREDNSHGVQRIEVLCRLCEGHLGHVFGDAPDQPTGLRFCINSTALSFEPDKNVQESTLK